MCIVVETAVVVSEQLCCAVSPTDTCSCDNLKQSWMITEAPNRAGTTPTKDGQLQKLCLDTWNGRWKKAGGACWQHLSPTLWPASDSADKVMHSTACVCVVPVKIIFTPVYSITWEIVICQTVALRWASPSWQECQTLDCLCISYLAVLYHDRTKWGLRQVRTVGFHWLKLSIWLPRVVPFENTYPQALGCQIRKWK